MKYKDTFMQTAYLFSTNSTCPRKQVGCILVRAGRIIVTAYNGAPPNQPHCEDVGCIIGPEGGCIRASHAEANAIAWAARNGTPTTGSELYTTLSPCLACAKLIAVAGVVSVHCGDAYRNLDGIELLNSMNIHTSIEPQTARA